MKVKFETPQGTVVYFGVQDFEGVSGDADWRLYPPHQTDRESVDIQGTFLGAIDSTALPDDRADESVSEDAEVVDWRPDRER
jgi:hypothetical protein